jgi:hypothetical protein
MNITELPEIKKKEHKMFKFLLLGGDHRYAFLKNGSQSKFKIKKHEEHN